MADKPAGLIYGVDERPPWNILVLLAVQHVFLMSSTLLLPVVLVSEIGGGTAQVEAVVALTMIASGLGTILQAMRWRGIGSGFLCPNLCGPNFFAAAVRAAWLGGLPLMRGMTIAAGITEMLVARVIHRIEFLFPPVITGIVVVMVAVDLIPLGASKFVGIDYAGEYIDLTNLFVAALTLLIMAGVNVWGGSQLKLYSVLIGMLAGYGLSFVTGIASWADFERVADASWLALPAHELFWDLSFSWSLLPTFVIVSICGALKSFGNLIMAEKINDAQWTRPNIARVGNGLMADACAVTASGLLGGMPTDTSASNVSLSRASGATSRSIGVAAGGLFLALGFSPKLSAVLAIMPTPVMGAILVFVVSFMIMAGLQIILSKQPDAVDTFVVGIALIFGLSLEALPELYALVPLWLHAFFSSSLTFATVIAVAVNQLLRIGTK